MSCLRKMVVAVLLFGVILSAGCSMMRIGGSEDSLSFAVLADPRGGGETWKNALTELRNRKADHEPLFKPTELVVVAGDIDPAETRHKDFQNVFANLNVSPVLMPAIGNHEFENGGKHFRYARDVIIPAVPGAVRRHATSCDYYLDSKNVRIIVVDAYSQLGKHGVINTEGREWVEQVITAMPNSIDHIFVSFHEPAFPRYRHVRDSFNQDPKQRDAFWNMLLKHKDRVRAVLVGHTHTYYRMRVLDPAGKAANDGKSFPDEEGGIYQIDAGAAGNSKICTIVQIQTRGKDVYFRVLQAEKGASKPFKEVDQWSIINK